MGLSNAVRIESEGSFWYVDDVEGKYLRHPKTEGGRECPEWGGPEAGVLQDLVWHPMSDWGLWPGGWVDQLRRYSDTPRLWISSPDGSLMHAPLSDDECRRAAEIHGERDYNCW